MGWTNLEEKADNKKNVESTSKVLLIIIGCLAFIIIAIIVALISLQMNTVILSIDGKEQKDYDVSKLILDIEGETYIDIEKFSKIVEYEFHKGEYKSFSNEEDKCYVTGKNETATFYLNENKINKLPIESDIEEEYRENIIQHPTKIKDGRMYATIEAINVAFNVKIFKSETQLNVITLNQLVKSDNASVKKWGYTGITDQTFENQKALLYDRIIVKKEEGLYKIINRQNTKEIVPDKYTDIKFSESEQQFWVKNTLGKEGILDLNGSIIIEPIYDSITIFKKQEKMYIVEKDTKFGIIKSGNKEILDISYDAIGCNMTAIEINGSSKSVNPVLTIEECDGIAVKKEGKYGIIDIKGNIIVPIQADSIYSLKNEKNEIDYFMLYNGEELNIVNMLIEQGIIKDPNVKENTKEDKDNTNKIENTNNNIIITVLENIITNSSL